MLGIIAKLDYLKELGVDLLWISPFYPSPMDDNGYDISDYYGVDPVFGVNEDADRLIQEAKKRGIRIMLDMVINHCSDEHEWFQKALKDPEGKYGRYFYFRKGKEGNPPNNWRSIFGGSAWEKAGDSDYYYLHLFSKKQPDLNWENPQLREEIYKMMNWWLDKGVAGFRMDAITYLKKEEGLLSYPPDGEDGMVTVAHGALNKKGIGKFLEEIRDRTYGRVQGVTVGETSGISDEELLSFISLENGYFSMIFDFSYCGLNLSEPNFLWHEPKDWSVEDWKKRLFDSHRAAGEEGWLGLCLENHDQPRSIDFFLPPEGQNHYGASMLAMLYMLLRGTPYIYQGQEIGMRNRRFDRIEEFDDCSTINQYHMARAAGIPPEKAMDYINAMSRDNARIPFQWDDGKSAGFSTGVPWLPVHDNYREVNAKKVRENADSLFYWYKRLIGLRKDSPYSDILTEGSLKPALVSEKNLFAYERVLGDGRLLILCNYQAEERTLSLKKRVREVLLTNYKSPKWKEEAEGILCLRPFESILLDWQAEYGE